MRRVCRLYDLTKEGLTSYPLALQYQRALVNDIYQTSKCQNGAEDIEGSDALLLLQHSNVYTLGRGGTTDNIKTLTSDSFDERNPEIYRISRGGEVTWHGPGQLVAYPLLNLARICYKKDLRWYVHQLEETAIQTLKAVGIDGCRSSINPGVWVGRNKIAAIGISASRWITMHGLAINVSCDLSAYDNIIPCGISANLGGVTSIEKEIGTNETIEMSIICEHFRNAFAEIFGVEFCVDANHFNLHSIYQRHQHTACADVLERLDSAVFHLPPLV